MTPRQPLEPSAGRPGEDTSDQHAAVATTLDLSVGAVTQDLLATRVPVLVAHGETDDAWPPAWQRRTALTLAAPYEIIPAAGHCPAEENPTATAALLDSFWRR